MAEGSEIPAIAYHIGYKDPGNFPGWYEVYVVQDGTAASPSNFDSLVQFISEHLSRPENINKKAAAHNKTPDAFTRAQVERIDSLFNRHNEELSGLTAQLTSQ